MNKNRKMGIRKSKRKQCSSANVKKCPQFSSYDAGIACFIYQSVQVSLLLGNFLPFPVKSVERLNGEREDAGSVLRVLKYIDTQMKCFFFLRKSFHLKTLDLFHTFFPSIILTISCSPPPLTSLYKPDKVQRGRGHFLESRANFSGLESCFMFAVFAFMQDQSFNILKIIQ